ncbi:hypothetical protein UA08_03936 [Talaromyces atroroseus]|uniref:Ubiquitin-like domain-containing protein n=1 Tax=Talaromyces atroroseus TaxID=1441469 RepID=A0A225AYQ2_TALAT|nr:hypothetical protein UA08_03936 [Talaromyces atroroseus]OKL60839.1 hypothetical protein UA08_03936 [Talaromyces atroroseus]
MPFDIRINSDEDFESEHSSLSDDEGSSGVNVSSPSAAGSQDYYDGEWAHLSYPDEIGSDSASRTRASRRHIHHAGPSSRSRSGRRYSRRDIPPQREAFTQRTRRNRSPESPESEETDEEFLENYSRHQPDRRYWHPVAPAPVGGYPPSSSSGPSYNVFPNGLGHPHPPYPHAAPPHQPSDQLVRFGHAVHMGRPGQYGNTSPPYGYGGSPFPPPHHAAMPPFYGNDHLPGHPGPHPTHHLHQSHSRSRGQSPPEPPVPQLSHVPPPPNPHYAPFGPPDLIPYSANGYMPYNPNFPPIPGGMINHQLFGQLPRQPESPSTASQPDTSKDDAIARLEQLIKDERAEREARDAAREAALEKAAADKLAAEEKAAAEKKIADEAAAKATAIAKEEAAIAAAEEAIRAQKAAEELAANAAAEAKKAAEEAAAAAAAEAKKATDEAAAAAAEEAKKATEEAAAAAAAEAKKAAEEAAAKPPPEKKKPIKFKDAVGRKFSFPFHLCSTWQGMEELIRQAFLHVEVIGPHVAEGHYDLVGPNGDIILPQVWETVVEPDWTVTMHMWPIPEPKEPDPPPPPPPAEEPAPPPPAPEPKKKPDPAPKKPKPIRGDPGAFTLWMMGNTRPKSNTKALKVVKKPEIIQQNG